MSNIVQAIIAIIKKLFGGSNNTAAPTPAPVPAPTPNPMNPAGVSIQTGNFFGNGSFTAAVIDPRTWKNGGGKYEIRTWGDYEPLYTILVISSGGYLYNNQAMYRLADNTVVTISPDPFQIEPKPTPPDYWKLWAEIAAAEKPLKYYVERYGAKAQNQVLFKLEIVFGVNTAGTQDMYNKYLAGNAAVKAYVDIDDPNTASLSMAVRNGYDLPREVQAGKAKDLFQKYVGKLD